MAVKHTQSVVDRCQVLMLPEEREKEEGKSNNNVDRENQEIK